MSSARNCSRSSTGLCSKADSPWRETDERAPVCRTNTNDPASHSIVEDSSGLPRSNPLYHHVCLGILLRREPVALRDRLTGDGDEFRGYPQSIATAGSSEANHIAALRSAAVRRRTTDAPSAQSSSVVRSGPGHEVRGGAGRPGPPVKVTNDDLDIEVVTEQLVDLPLGEWKIHEGDESLPPTEGVLEPP